LTVAVTPSRVQRIVQDPLQSDRSATVIPIDEGGYDRFGRESDVMELVIGEERSAVAAGTTSLDKRPGTTTLRFGDSRIVTVHQASNRPGPQLSFRS
jgi:hypothetical protein